MSNSSLRQRITEEILTLRVEYISEGESPSYYEINNGQCDDFGEEIAKRIDAESVYTVCGENFMVDYPNGDERWDAKLLFEFWGMTPPEHLTWEMLNEIPFGNHVWVTDGKLHYDAEHPEGVESFFDLPVFQRPIVMFLRENGIRCPDVVTDDVIEPPTCPIPNPELKMRRPGP